jgi:L-rhamnose mutarotase
MKRYCFALDLKDDPSLIQEYENWHRKVWPEILESIRDSGIESMHIYRTGNRLFMIMEVADDFTFERKAAADQANERVRDWETMMWEYQQGLPWARKDEKWVLMDPVFDLNESLRHAY